MTITTDPIKDQFFLTDEKIIQKIVDAAELNERDVVLEVGAGTGNLTKEIAKKAGRVISFEIDEQFKPFLNKLPGNVQIYYENALDYIQLQGKWRKKKEYNKVVSNPPYSFLEPFLHNLTFLDYDKVILVVPKKTLKTIKTSGIFSSFFNPKVLFDIPRNSFSPIPDTNSVVIDLEKKKDPIETKDMALFLRQYMYQHEGQMVKNSLMEGIIKYKKKVEGKFFTKNEARKITKESGISEKLLEKEPDTSEIYTEVSDKFKSR